MKEEKVMVNGEEFIIPISIPKDEYEDYYDINIDDTLDLKDVVEKVNDLEKTQEVNLDGKDE